MEIKIYDVLPQSAVDVRTAVFIEEQGFVNEMDETDQTAVHLVMFDGEKPVAACRVFWSDGRNSYVLGRLAVLKPYRGKMLGTEMMKRAEQYVRDQGGGSIALHAQCRVMDFYRKQGFEERGPVEEEEGCPHMWMYKVFK